MERTHNTMCRFKLLLLCIGILSPALALRAQFGEMSSTLPPLVVGAVVSDLPRLNNNAGINCPSTRETFILTAWGDVDSGGTQGSGGTENPYAYNDAPVSGGIYIAVLLVLLYGLIVYYRQRTVSTLSNKITTIN